MAHLSEVAEVRLGRQRSPKNHSGTRMRPYLRAGNVTWSGLDLSDVKTMNFTMDESEVYELHAGDVLVSEASGSASEVGKPAMWRDEIPNCCFQNTLLRVRSYGPLPEYLMYVLRTDALTGRLGDAARGVGIHHIGAQRLSSWMIPVAPLPEQRRIVAVVEEQFSRLDAAEALLHLVKRRLSSLRRSVLVRAVDGDWPVSPLGDVIVSLRNGVFVSRPAAEPPGIPIFRISAVRPLFLDVNDVRFADIEPDQAKGYVVEDGDLLFTRYSGNPDYVGACARVTGLRTPTLHPDKLIRVVVDPERAESAFVAIALSTGSGRRAIEERRKTTAGQVGIAGSELKKAPIPVPPLGRQKCIVAEVERQLSLVAAMNNEVEVALRRSASLRRSILERAFNGSLVPQDPSDEPASVLLGRMAAQQMARVNRNRAAASKRRQTVETS